MRGKYPTIASLLVLTALSILALSSCQSEPEPTPTPVSITALRQWVDENRQSLVDELVELVLDGLGFNTSLEAAEAALVELVLDSDLGFDDFQVQVSEDSLWAVHRYLMFDLGNAGFYANFSMYTSTSDGRDKIMVRLRAKHYLPRMVIAVNDPDDPTRVVEGTIEVTQYYVAVPTGGGTEFDWESLEESEPNPGREHLSQEHLDNEPYSDWEHLEIYPADTDSEQRPRYILHFDWERLESGLAIDIEMSYPHNDVIYHVIDN